MSTTTATPAAAPVHTPLKFVQKDIPLEKLTINPDNLRFRGGMRQDGIAVTDTYNLSTMKDAIRTEGGIPGRLVVEQMPDTKDSTGKTVPGLLIVLAGNRRTAAAKELYADTSTSVALREALEKVACNVYKDLTERQRRELVNDQRSQKYMRSELDVYIWKLQASGLNFPEIAMFVWQQLATYTGGGAKKVVDIERCGTEADRQKEITTWLKGTLDNIILTCGKLGPRVRRALLLYDMALDGISPPLLKDGQPVVDDKGAPVYELCEFKPTQGRCGDLRKAMKADPNWTAENGGLEFNALIAKYIRQDKGLDDNGDPVKGQPNRATAELLVEQTGRTQSKAAKVALEFARGLKPMHYADVDAEAFRVEELLDMAVKKRNDVKNEVVKQLLQIFLTGDKFQLEVFCATHS